MGGREKRGWGGKGERERLGLGDGEGGWRGRERKRGFETHHQGKKGTPSRGRSLLIEIELRWTWRSIRRSFRRGRTRRDGVRDPTQTKRERNPSEGGQLELDGSKRNDCSIRGAKRFEVDGIGREILTSDPITKNPTP